MPLKDFIDPIRSSKTLARVSLYALLVGLYSLIPTAVEFTELGRIIDTPSEFHGVLTLVLGCLLVFRTNTAYSRWWEARTLWGALVNATRNLALKFATLGVLNADERRRAGIILRLFATSLRCHLRGEPNTSPLLNDVKIEVVKKHMPQELARQLYAIVAEARRAGRMDGDELRVIDSDLARLMDVCGGCERILRTRIVKSYRVFSRQCVFIFLGTLPWGIVHDFRLWTIPLVVITAYFMLGLETVAEHVEEPFGYDEDDLDLEGICAAIESSVIEVFANA